MGIREYDAKSVLVKRKRLDSWLVSRYGMNLYRGCLHNCIYCDGRAETYYTPGEFGRDVAVKSNAPELLSRELDPKRRKKPFAGGYFMLGGGVGDSYQPLEERRELARRALEILLRFRHPVHVLTKSVGIQRDLDLIARIHRERGALISVSFSTVDRSVAAILEPGVPPPEERLELLRRVKDYGIPCGMFLMPVIPGLTDDQASLHAALSAARACGVDYVIYGGLTLKAGRQRRYFFSHLADHFPGLQKTLESYYATADRRSIPTERYTGDLARRIRAISRKQGLALRIPIDLISHTLSLDEKILIVLEYADYHLRMIGVPSRFQAAANSLIRAGVPDRRSVTDALSEVTISSGEAREMIDEIIQSGDSQSFRSLLEEQDRCG